MRTTSGQAIDTRPFGLALVLAAASGCAALAHELLWTRRLVDLLGASSASSTRVFGCFFLGLSLGAAWSARMVPRLRRPFRAVAMAEAGIALLTVPIWLLPHWTGWIWPALGPERLAGWQGGAVKLVLSIATVTAPATLMGAVLPFLGAAVLRDARGLARHGVWLYAVNTLGGVLGLALVIGVALDALGASGAMAGAIALNAVVATLALLLDRKTGAEPGEDAPAAAPRQRAGRTTTPERARRVRRAALIVSFASGAGVLALEVLALEMVMLRTPLSFHATAAVLIPVILLLAVASLVVPVLTPRRAPPPRLLIGALALTAMAIVVTPPAFWYVAIDPSWDAPAPSVLRFALRLTALVLFTFGPAMVLAGLVFPTALAWSAAEGNDPHGRRWGALLAVNGVGAVVGAEATYRLLMPGLGVDQSASALAVVYALVAVWLLLESRRIGAGPPGRPVATVLVVMAMLAVLGGYRVRPRAQPGVLDERSGREGTVRVVEHPRFGRALLVNNHYLLGTTGGRWDEERQTHLALALHPAPRTVAHVGFGTGITPGAALHHPEVESVTSLELSALVRDAAARHFAEFNHRITDTARATVVVEDGRTYIASTVNAFDVVIGDVFLPWGRGDGRLYSLEHFRAVRTALRPGGVFCQWLPMHQLTREQFALIAATFARVFPDVHLFQLTYYLRAPGLALIGFRDADLDWRVVRDRSAAARADGILDPVARHRDAIAMLYLGRYHPPADGSVPVNTLNNVALELSAARERVTGDIPAKYLLGPAWLQFVQGTVLGSDGLRTAPPRVRRLARLGVLASEYHHARDGKGAQAERLGRALRAQLPAALTRDRGADWSRWPGDRALFAEPAPSPHRLQ